MRVMLLSVSCLVVLGALPVIGMTPGTMPSTSRPATGEVHTNKADMPASMPSGWRGDGSGIYADAKPPLEWDSDEKKNILWKVSVGSSYSSPVVVAGRIVLTSEGEKLTCIDIKTQKVLWERTNTFNDLPKELGAKEKRNPTSCGFSTATPLTDGAHVWVSFGTGIVACYDLEGNRKWITWFDNPQQSEYGRTASPLLVDGKLMVTVGFLIALEPATGKMLWTCKEAKEGFGTAAIMRSGQSALAITSMGDVVRVSDGALVERTLATCTYNSPVVVGNKVYFGDVKSSAFEISAGEGGKITFKKIWEAELEGEFFASPVIYDGILYVASNEGAFHALDAATGTEIYKQQLDIASTTVMLGMSPGNLYPSLAVAGGKLFVSNDMGQTLVVQPGKEFKLLAKNYVEDRSGSNIVFDGQFVYLRGGEYLYCIGK